MGIERIYGADTHPGLSIKVPMSETGQNRDSQGREYSRLMDIVFLIVTKNNIKRPFGILPNVYNVKTAEAPDWTSRN